MYRKDENPFFIFIFAILNNFLLSTRYEETLGISFYIKSSWEFFEMWMNKFTEVFSQKLPILI